MEPHRGASPRDIAALVVPKVGSVRATDDPVLPWAVVDSARVPAGLISTFLRAQRSEVRDFVVWLLNEAVFEQTWSLPMPYLFQRRFGAEDRPLTRSNIRECLFATSKAAQTTTTTTGGGGRWFEVAQARRTSQRKSRQNATVAFGAQR